jgi:chaperonin cofactor prefoldin
MDEHTNIRIRTLSEALDRANEKVSMLEQALIEAKRTEYDDRY